MNEWVNERINESINQPTLWWLALLEEAIMEDRERDGMKTPRTILEYKAHYRYVELRIVSR